MTDPLHPLPPLERAADVMDRLRSPGGCPWDAAQTHESLTRYLIEECFEVVEAIETDDPALLREELGDLLLQVLFHARLAQERHGSDAFGIDDVAADLVTKLVRRHPHVFDPDATRPQSVEQLNDTWERQKVVEKGRSSAADGVPLGQPALALTAKLLTRAARSGIDVREVSVPDPADGAERTPHVDDVEIGERLYAVVRDAVAAGVDPETALRNRARRLRAAIVAVEASTPPSA